MSRLVLCDRHLEAVKRHAAASYPEECCGFLLGRSSGPERAVLVDGVLPAPNERSESRGNRFLIGPETVLAAQREARGRHLEVVGYYHSHPDHPAEPSTFDREHAWPGLSYLIVPVRAGRAGQVRSYRLADDRSRFEEEPVTCGPAAGSEVAVAREEARR